MRIGVLGGTFDPVHIGHLIMAEQAREQAGLEQVWFVPSARPPHKSDRPVTSFERRVEMLQLALAGQPNFRVETIEKDRPGPSYTVDTLTDLHRAHPGSDIHLILGADCLPDFHAWHEPMRILQMAALLAAPRPHSPVWTAEQLAGSLESAAAGISLAQIEMPQIEISSSDLRRRAAAGRSLLYLVPRAVEVYIREKHLYG